MTVCQCCVDCSSVPRTEHIICMCKENILYKASNGSFNTQQKLYSNTYKPYKQQTKQYIINVQCEKSHCTASQSSLTMIGRVHPKHVHIKVESLSENMRTQVPWNYVCILLHHAQFSSIPKPKHSHMEKLQQYKYNQFKFLCPRGVPLMAKLGVFSFRVTLKGIPAPWIFNVEIIHFTPVTFTLWHILSHDFIESLRHQTQVSPCSDVNSRQK